MTILYKVYENFNASISEEKFSSPLSKYPQTTRSKTGGFNKSGKIGSKIVPSDPCPLVLMPLIDFLPSI